jgi:hypothetical protein
MKTESVAQFDTRSLAETFPADPRATNPETIMQGLVWPDELATEEDETPWLRQGDLAPGKVTLLTSQWKVSLLIEHGNARQFCGFSGPIDAGDLSSDNWFSPAWSPEHSPCSETRGPGL